MALPKKDQPWHICLHCRATFMQSPRDHRCPAGREPSGNVETRIQPGDWVECSSCQTTGWNAGPCTDCAGAGWRTTR